MELHTVGDLVKHLSQFDADRPLIVDIDGNTFPPDTEDINLWDETADDSPIAILTSRWVG